MKHRGRGRGQRQDLQRATMVQRGVVRLALAREASPGVAVGADDPRLAVDLAPAEEPDFGVRSAGVILHEKPHDTLVERYADFALLDSTGVRLSSSRTDDTLAYLPIQIGKTDSLGAFTEVAQVDVENGRVGINGTPAEALHVQGGNILTSHELRWMDGGLWEGRLSHANTDHRTYTFPNVDGVVWTSGNDGSGSTLDADLLDGLDATAFALVGHTHAFTDLSDVTVAGASTGDYVRKSAGDWVNVTITQVLTDLKTVDGAGSGLDADTLDGLNSTAFQPIDATLTAFAALTIVANSLTIGTGADAFSQTSFAANTFPARASAGNLVAKTITDFGLSLVDDVDASTARTTLGLGTIAVENTPLALSKGGTNADLSATGGASFVLRQSSAGAAITVSQLASTDISGFDEAAQDAAASLIQNGTGITWSYNDGANTLTPTVTLAPFSTTNLAEGANLYYTDERVDDRVAVLIQNGTGISWVYSDAGGTLTPAVSLAPFSTGDLSEGANLYFTNERVDDRVAALVQNGTGITWSYNDGAGTLTPTVSLAAFSTTDLAEGANLYFTNERAQDAVGAALADSTSIDLIYDDAGNAISAQREALTGDVTAAKNSNATTIANDAVTFAKMANAAAWTMVIRNAGSAGDLSAAALADWTTEGTPASGMYVVGYLGTGELRKFDIGTFPAPAHTLLSASHSDTLADSVVRGDVLVGNATPKWSRFPIGAANRVFFSNGTDPSWSQIDISTAVITGTLPIANGGTGQTTQTSAFDALAPTTAVGQFIVHDGTDNVALDVEANHTVPVADDTEAVGWKVRELEEVDLSYHARRGQSWVEHWTTAIESGSRGWRGEHQGTGGAVTLNALGIADTNHTGIAEFSTGTTATGRASLHLGVQSVRIGGGVIIVESMVRLEDLSTLAQEYDVYIGLSNKSNPGTDHWVYFAYDRNTNINWLIRTRDNGVETSTDSGVAVAADTWVKLRFEINAAGTSVEFFIDDTSVGTITTDIPTAAGREVSPRITIQKSAGTTARLLYVDWYSYQHRYTTAA